MIAWDMLKIYGEGASAEAAKRVEGAKSAQQPEAEKMWNEVCQAIVELKPHAFD
jgi:hypothetical protein